MAKTIHLTRADFLAKVANYETNPEKWVYLGDKPCIIDFYADWCGPCKMMMPTIEEIASDYSGRVRVGKLNTDENPGIASASSINAIPTVMLYKNGEVVEKFVGVTPKERFAASLDSQL